jgi:hypothetical protein
VIVYYKSGKCLAFTVIIVLNDNVTDGELLFILGIIAKALTNQKAGTEDAEFQSPFSALAVLVCNIFSAWSHQGLFLAYF